MRAFGAAGREQARLSRRIANEMSAQRKSLRSLERLRLFHAVSVFVVTAGVLAWAMLWRAGSTTTGDVVLTTTLGITLLGSSRDLAMAMVDLLQHFAKLGEAVKELRLPHEMVDTPDAKPLINLGGSVIFDKVWFSYPDGERVLQDFDLRIPPGQTVGLVGRSGAGKSTILALLQRLYDPTAGRVLIDGQDIAHVTQESLRRSIAVVHQDISLLHRSVLENLRYGRPDATDEEVYQATEAAHCTEFIRRLPQGFQTIVGERDLKLSGGQRQRIAIARAFLSGAPIILLDEATSALDTEVEQAIQERIDAAHRGAHSDRRRASAVHLDTFDRIIVLEWGRIIEDGSSAELLRKVAFTAECTASSSPPPRSREQASATPLPLALLVLALLLVAAASAGAESQPGEARQGHDPGRSGPGCEVDADTVAAGATVCAESAGGADAAEAGRDRRRIAASREAPHHRRRASRKRRTTGGEQAEVLRHPRKAAKRRTTGGGKPEAGAPPKNLKPIAPEEAVGILGKKVYGPAGEDMGMVVEALVDGDGRPRAAVVDFGGFLGVGSRKIAIDWELLQFRPADREQRASHPGAGGGSGRAGIQAVRPAGGGSRATVGA